MGENSGNEVDVMLEGNKFRGDKFFPFKRFFVDGKLQVESWLILQWPLSRVPTRYVKFGEDCMTSLKSFCVLKEKMF